MDQSLENLLLANMKGSYIIFKIKFFLAYLEIFFVPLSLKTTQNNRSSPHNGPIKKNLLTKSYFSRIIDNEILQNSKSEQRNSHSCVPLRIVGLFSPTLYDFICFDV
jgi:hypothetical protein